MDGLLSNPDILERLVQLAMGMAGLIISIAGILVSAYLPGWAKAFVEGKNARLLHSALETWAATAVRRGVTEANKAAVDDFLEYARESVPDALAAMHPSLRVLEGLVGRYIAKVAK